MVFCDSCNLCVHQACYGLPSLPQGGWLCRACTVGQGRHTSCVLCSSTGGALKRVRCVGVGVGASSVPPLEGHSRELIRCVCVCVCARARACVRVCNLTSTHV